MGSGSFREGCRLRRAGFRGPMAQRAKEKPGARAAEPGRGLLKGSAGHPKTGFLQGHVLLFSRTGPEENVFRHRAHRGRYRPPCCGRRASDLRRLAPSRSKGLSAAHQRRGAASALSLGQHGTFAFDGHGLSTGLTKQIQVASATADTRRPIFLGIQGFRV